MRSSSSCRRRSARSASSTSSASRKQTEAIAAMVGSKSPSRFDHICTATGRTRAELTNSETISSSKVRIIATSSDDSTAGSTSGRVTCRKVAHGGAPRVAAASSSRASCTRSAEVTVATT